MKNKLQPTRTSFSRIFQCKKAPCWLSKFFHFGTENRADQLKNHPVRKLTNSTRAYWIAGGFATWWRGAKCARTLVSVKPGRDAQVVTGCDSCCSYPPPSWWTSGSKWSKILLHLDGPALFFNAHCPLPDLAYLSFGHPKDRLQFL